MKKGIIVAMDDMALIAVDGHIPWHIPEDLQHFKKVTMGNGNNAVIMGRKTFESLPKPLHGRKNYVVSRSMREGSYDEYTVVSSLQQALDSAESEGFDEAWVIGGHNLYLAMRYLWDIAEMTIVFGNYANPEANSHTYFPLAVHYKTQYSRVEHRYCGDYPVSFIRVSRG